MAWKKAYPSKVVNEVVAALQKIHKIKISKAELEEAIQRCKSTKDLSVEINKQFKKAKAVDIQKTLSECGFG